VILGSSAVACAPARSDVLIGRAGLGPQLLRSPGDVVRRGNPLVTSSVLVRREVLAAVGGFREGMPRSADFELWLRVLEHGTGWVSPDVTVRYHVHGDQITHDLPRTYDAYEGVVDAARGQPWMSRAVAAEPAAQAMFSPSDQPPRLP
jgi:hypothetical protein